MYDMPGDSDQGAQLLGTRLSHNTCVDVSLPLVECNPTTSPQLLHVERLAIGPTTPAIKACQVGGAFDVASVQ